MPKLTRIYTRTGDDGTTGLVGGQRVAKSSARIEAFGTIDELSSTIGLARSELTAMRQSPSPPSASPKIESVLQRLDAWLAWTQDLLFNLGSELATLPTDTHIQLPRLTDADVDALERAIDEAQVDLAPLANFIHPGGSRASAVLHIARTIARRGERYLVSIAAAETIEGVTLRYINRLSDALFVWSRWVNQAAGEKEALWNQHTTPPERAQ